MKIVITGGAGFIGSNTANYYLKQGDDVVIFDNLSREGSKKNLRWLKDLGGKLKVVIGDVRKIDDVLALRSDLVRADAIIHLAAQVAVTTSVENPHEDFAINALGTFNVLESARMAKSKAKFIYSSTNKVYGGMDDVSIIERNNRYQYKSFPKGISEDQPLDFHSPYGCSKGAADQYVHDYSRIYGLDTVVFRQSCIYGPRQFGVEDQGWVAWFIIATALGKKLTIYGDGKQIRDLLYVDDLVRAYDLAIMRKEVTKGKVYNIGGGPQNTMSVWTEFGPMLERLFQRKIKVKFRDWRPGDQRVFVADITKAKKEFNWKPKIGIKKGIEKLYNWVINNKKLFHDA